MKSVWGGFLEYAYLRYNRKTRELFANRDTYEDELNFHVVRYFFLLVIGLFIWLFYIPGDADMHRFPALAVSLRAMLSAVSAVCFFLTKTDVGVRRPMLVQKILLTYMVFAAAVITGTSGASVLTYSGGYIIAVLVIVAVPFGFRYKAAVMLSSLAVFAMLGAFFHENGAELVYAMRNVSVATFLAAFLSWVHNSSRRDSWLLHKKLSHEMKKNEKSLLTISGLAQQAEESSRAKSSFLAKMSHEIRTPMNAVAGAAEIALRENPPEQIKEQILTIKHSSASLLSIINDILDFSKIESGKMEIVETEYRFASLVSDVVSIVNVRMFDSRASLVVELDPRVPCRLIGDEVRIRQVLLNILSNAVKYTEKGFITFEARLEGEETLVFSVADTGRGIKPGDMDRLFEDFAQFDLMDRRNIEGTGLGLPIAKSLVSSMEGSMLVESEVGRGSLFTVRLPLKAADRTPFASVDGAAEKNSLVYMANPAYGDSIAKSLRGLGVFCETVQSPAAFAEKLGTGVFRYVFVSGELYAAAEDAAARTGMADAKLVAVASFAGNVYERAYGTIVLPAHTLSIANILGGAAADDSRSAAHCATFRAPDAKILIVDDIETNRFVAKGLLKPYEMQTALCSGGRAALEACARERFDLVLMDHMMPDMDGVEAARHIRDFSGYRDIPIIALTANAIAGNREMFLASGFDDCLFKPIDTGKLNAALEKWVPKEKQRRAADGRRARAKAAERFVLDDMNFDRAAVADFAAKDNNRRLLSVFVADARLKSAEIARSAQKSMGEFAVHIHAMRGACANIGAEYLSRFAADLEMAAKRGDGAYVLSKLERFVARLESLTGRLADFLGEPPPGEAGGGSLGAALDALEAAIAEMEPDKMEAAQKKLAALAGGDAGGKIDRLLDFALNGDYDDALELIAGLRGRAVRRTI